MQRHHDKSKVAVGIAVGIGVSIALGLSPGIGASLGVAFGLVWERLSGQNPPDERHE